MIAQLASRSTAPIILLVLSCGADRLSAQCCNRGISERPQLQAVLKNYRHGRWHVAETANFQVYSEESASSADGLASHAEALRTELASKWFGDNSVQSWKPLCQVVLHQSRRGYVKTVGPGSERTLGSSAVCFDNGRITSRRIDLLGGDKAYLTDALPHELTHVVLRDRFSSGTFPRWADEGMAMVADTDAKQARHVRDLQAAIASGTEFYVADLLTMREYPRSDRRQAFYGQSVFVTKFLIARKDPQQFVKFVERASVVGYDPALKECYDITDAAQLDRLWRRDLYTTRLASTE